MFIDETTSRKELEMAIMMDSSLYASFDERKLLDGFYTDDELRDGIREWIQSGNEVY